MQRLLYAVRLRATLRAITLASLALWIGPATLSAAPPLWWSERGVIRVDPATGQPAAADDFAAANQGQLKKIATAAFAEFQARLTTLPGGVGGIGDMTAPNGTGYRLTQLIAGFAATPTAATNDFAGFNLGQLKAVAKPFYDRLIEVGFVSAYPWTNNPTPTNDFALANLGQLKNVFSFDIAKDTDGDGLPDWWERVLGTNSSSADSDGDGIPDGWEVANGLNPNLNDAGANSDGDDYTNLEEYVLGLNPRFNEYANGVRTQVYTYDDTNRLSNAGGGFVEAFIYDPEANLTNGQ